MSRRNGGYALRNTIQAAKLILGIDPGLTTGVAMVNGKGQYPELVMAGVIHLSEAISKLSEIIAQRPDLVVFEGWEMQGRRVNISCVYPNQVIGMVKALCHIHKVPYHELFASSWKTEYCHNGLALPEPVRVDKGHQAMANAIYHDLGLWPEPLLTIKPKTDLRHAIDAAGLALFAGAVLRSRAPKRKTKGARAPTGKQPPMTQSSTPA